MLALIAFLALLAVQRANSRLPYALVVFVIGLILSLLAHPTLPSFDIYQPHVSVPNKKHFVRGALGAGLGQIPLTTLNSIIAIPSLCITLLPQCVPPNVTQIGISVALMNLVGGWFGAMPVCHGSGGLAGQHRFGARSGASIIILGLFKLTLGVIFGESLLGLLKAFPKSLLGIMVIAAGLELANVGESLNSTAADLVDKDSGTPKQIEVDERKRRWTIMLVTVAGILTFKNDGVGFVAGMLCHWSYFVGAMTERWYACQRDPAALYGRTSDAPNEHQPLLADQS